MIRRFGVAIVFVMAFLILGASLEDVATRPEIQQEQ